MDSAVTLSIIAGATALSLSVAARMVAGVERDATKGKLPQASSRADIKRASAEMQEFLKNRSYAARRLKLLMLLGAMYVATSIWTILEVERRPESALSVAIHIVSIVAAVLGIGVMVVAVAVALKTVRYQQKSIEKKVEELKQLARR